MNQRITKISHNDFKIAAFKKVEGKKYTVDFTSKYGTVNIPVVSTKRKKETLIKDFEASFQNWPVNQLGYEMVKNKKTQEYECQLIFYGTFKGKHNCLRSHFRENLKKELTILNDDRKRMQVIAKKCDERLKKISRLKMGLENYK